MDGLNWSGYDGLTTGALTLSTAAVDINSQEKTSSLQALQEEVRTLERWSGGGTTTITGNPRWETEPEQR